MESRMLKLRWPATCSGCGASLPGGAYARWTPETHAVTCAGCVAASEQRVAAGTPRSAPLLDRGRAGWSAQREYLRRKHNRELRMRREHPLVGGLMLSLSREPQHQTAFRKGGVGEASVARALERLTARGPTQLLHDRRMPLGRGNIDHLAVAPTGVFVIDAKAIRGAVRVAQPLVGAPRLIVNGRRRTKLVDGLDRQVRAVRRVLEEDGHPGVLVHGTLCFTKADLPLFGRCEINGYRLRHQRGVARALNRKGALAAEEIDALAHQLAIAFPPA
jgi:hypothetical protein